MSEIESKHVAFDRVKTLPESPGVYIMKDKDGKIIYIGKAKSLKDRVRSYFSFQDTRAQISFLLNKLITIDSIVTENEEQAFVLESDLIKKYQPRYNIRLKDDKAFLSVKINKNEDWPRLQLVRRIDNDGSKYFGPYSSGSELRGVIDLIKTVIPLRTCSNTVFHNRQRPCLEYEIKRCAGPCCLDVDKAEYDKWIRQAERILEGKSAEVAFELSEKMEKASEEMRFEEAAIFRDRLAVLENFKAGKDLISYQSENRDIFGIFREASLAALSVIHVRDGRIGASNNFTLDELIGSNEEVIESVILQYYEGAEIPDEIIVPLVLENSEMICNKINQSRSTNTQIIAAKRGIRRRLLSIAELNAKQSFNEKFNAEARYSATAEELSKLFKLSQVPRNIECVDISNIQGSHIVAAIVSFNDGQPDKSFYRKYKMSVQGKPDDFKSMHEVVTRRLRRGMEEDTLPDLLIVDGGMGQLNAALRAREELKINIEIISLAKRRLFERENAEDEEKPERVFLAYENEPILLPKVSPVTQLMERIRDEAHRFVITFHRKLRDRQSLAAKSKPRK